MSFNICNQDLLLIDIQAGLRKTQFFLKKTIHLGFFWGFSKNPFFCFFLKETKFCYFFMKN